MEYLFEVYGTKGPVSLAPNALLDRIEKVEELRWTPEVRAIIVYHCSNNFAQPFRVLVSEEALKYFVDSYHAARKSSNKKDEQKLAAALVKELYYQAPPSAVPTEALSSCNYDKEAKASHYQGYFVNKEAGLDLQWIEAIRCTGRFKDPYVFEACLELLVRNYLDRLGKKDDKLQELKKSRWYLDYWISVVESQQQLQEAKDGLNLWI